MTIATAAAAAAQHNTLKRLSNWYLSFNHSLRITLSRASSSATWKLFDNVSHRPISVTVYRTRAHAQLDIYLGCSLCTQEKCYRLDALTIGSYSTYVFQIHPQNGHTAYNNNTVHSSFCLVLQWVSGMRIVQKVRLRAQHNTCAHCAQRTRNRHTHTLFAQCWACLFCCTNDEQYQRLFFFQHKSCVYARGIRIWMGCIVWPAALRYTIMRMRIRVRMHPRPQLIFNTGKMYVWLEPTSFSSSPSWFCVLLRANSSMRDWCPRTLHYQMNSQMVIRCQNGNYSYQHSLHQLDGFVWFMLIVH